MRSRLDIEILSSYLPQFGGGALPGVEMLEIYFSDTTCCGLIGFNARNLTREDSRMRVTLKGLPDKLRSAAWPSSVRAVKCRVKSRNEQDPCR